MTRTKGSKRGISRYPVFYHIRVSKITLNKLKRIGSERIRKVLEDL